MTARKRVAVPQACTEGDLRRATSDLYYSLFHRICEALVEPIGSDSTHPAFVDTFRTIYRLPDHALIERRCKDILSQDFSNEVKRFAQHVISLKNKRQSADYDPLDRFAISDVRNDLDIAETALDGLDRATPQERTRFAFFVSLDRRPK